MRMQKEEKIVVVLLLMALGSLAVAEWTFGSSDQSAVTGKSDSSISVEGHVLGMTTTKTGGNLVFQLDTTNNSIFVPGSSGAKDIQGRVHSGDNVRIRGMLSEFNGKKEIKVARSSDVEVIRT
jgi:DNA/RNA endonuclease YhcR with UshA esterase domain